MERQTVTTETYKFDELSDGAKEKAREWWRSCSQEDIFWSECVIEDATIIAELFGLDIENVYFSGFSCQGDGACFEGSYSYKNGGLKAIRSHAPQDKELHGIVEQLQTIQRKAFYQLSATTRQSGHYNHSGCMSVDVSNDNDRLYYPDVTDEQEQDVTDELRCFADWIYRRLEAEWDYINDDKQVDDSITTNEYDFTEDGSIY